MTCILSKPAEFEFFAPPAGDADVVEDVVTLGPADFQRIGIQPTETRLAVIRHAASRAAKSLARRQLSAPNPLTEQQLSRIAVSTYRLLDPRQRMDRHSRAHVGRIRPAALYRAGRAEFADGPILIQSCDASESSTTTHHVDEVCQGRAFASDVTTLQDVRPTAAKPVLTLRRLATRPSLILTMIVTLLLTAGAVWNWGHHRNAGPERSLPAANSR
ncbi:hypothetical protein NZK35_33825 [Stieleria sp. ICT_E10.1]|uniref:hypothetical protein n=1 Tax=Stieleria sedimenti TaxID=2976331 RepID=UPI002180002C|nr:hypothetical protein [Stieleria sedimenti]MCS7471655.1 hypothetical protein [Stieleria sedimenti]